MNLNVKENHKLRKFLPRVTVKAKRKFAEENQVAYTLKELGVVLGVARQQHPLTSSTKDERRVE